MQQKKQQSNKGFTLVEVMIATAIFVVIMVMGIGAVLAANSSHKETQSLHTIVDNLSFAMEDMSRNLRLGYSYHCQYESLPVPIEEPLDCALGEGALSLAFEKQGGDSENPLDQVVYRINSSDIKNVYIDKSTDSGNTFYPITPNILGDASMEIDPIHSGFVVLGADPEDKIQPMVAIRLKGSISIRGTVTPFNLETVVSQRAIDSGI